MEAQDLEPKLPKRMLESNNRAVDQRTLGIREREGEDKSSILGSNIEEKREEST